MQLVGKVAAADAVHIPQVGPIHPNQEVVFVVVAVGKLPGRFACAVYPPACRKLAEHGIDCTGKTARQLTNSDYDKYDLLIGMDRANLRNMHRICGGDFASKLHLLMDYTDHPGDVADPWYTDDFETTWQDVLEGCTNLLERLKSEGKVC